MERVTIGEATMIHGDCLEVLHTLADASVAWAVTSPPYNLNKAYATSPGAATETNATMRARYDEWYADDLPEEQYQREQHQVVRELLRVCTDSVFYNHRVRYAWHSRNRAAPPSRILHPLQWLGEFPIWCEIIWDRCGGSTPTGRYLQAHELIYQIGRPRRYAKSPGITDVWRIPPDQGSGHVCAFPVQLVRNCLAPHAIAGEVVIDPYAGSGTVGVACAELGLRFVGIERDRKYFDLACDRIERAQRQGTLTWRTA